MTKILPEIIQDRNDQSFLIFDIDKADANEKYEILAYKRNRSHVIFQPKLYGPCNMLHIRWAMVHSL